MLPSPWRATNPYVYNPSSPSDPIRCEADGWYFWDETWCDKHGPFATYKECSYMLVAYCDANGLT